MLSAEVLILEYICPGLGVITANIMFASPFKDLKKAVERGDLGDLNPTPWAFMLGNCLGWVTYGILLQNPWIFFGNCPGFLMSVWFNLGAVKLSYLKHHAREIRNSVTQLLVNQERRLSLRQSSTLLSIRATSTINTDDGEKDDESRNHVATFREDLYQSRSAADWAKLVFDVTSQKMPVPAPHENLIMAIIFIWVICISVICLVPTISQRAREFIVASLVNVNLVFFYGAPLSTIYTVLRQKNSSSIHIPTMATNTLNGVFWTAYGFAIFNLFIAIPNGLGTLFGVVQIFLCIIFPREHQHNAAIETDLVVVPVAVNQSHPNVDVER